MLVIAITPTLLFTLWIVAEIYGTKAARITIGALTMISIVICGMVAYQAGQVLPRYESKIHRNSLAKLKTIIESGDTPKASQALKEYESIAGSQSTYAAALRLWDILNAPTQEKLTPET